MNTDKATPELFAALSANGVYFLCSPRYPNHLVSDDGRVFSIRNKRFLKGMMAGKYLSVQVTLEDGTAVRRYVHRLALEFATGVCPKTHDACHNDGNRLNNSIDNLRWDSRSANHADKRIHGTARIGESNHMARLNAQQVREIRYRAGRGAIQSGLAKEYGVSPMTVSRIVNNHTWSHVA